MKFCQHMLSKIPHRLTAIHHLAILEEPYLIGFAQVEDFSLWEECKATAPILSAMLNGARNLRFLVLENAAKWFYADCRIATAISSMSLLSHLDLGGFGKFHHYTLPYTRSHRKEPAVAGTHWQRLDLTLENPGCIEPTKWIDMGSIHHVNITCSLREDPTPGGCVRDGGQWRCQRDQAVQIVQLVEPVALQAAIQSGMGTPFMQDLLTASWKLRYLHITLTKPDIWLDIARWWVSIN